MLLKKECQWVLLINRISFINTESSRALGILNCWKLTCWKWHIVFKAWKNSIPYLDLKNLLLKKYCCAVLGSAVGWAFLGNKILQKILKVGLSRFRKFFPNWNFPQPCSKKYHHLFVSCLKLKIIEFKIANFVFLKNRLI